MRRPALIVLITLMFALLTGCGPKMTPLLASRELTFDVTPNRADAARVGESLVSGSERFTLPAFTSILSGQLPSPDQVPALSIENGRLWVVQYQLGDGSFVVEPMPGIRDSGPRLGLRVDASGRVKGHRPWFDLDRKCRISQPFWGGALREAFRPGSTYPVDEFVFDLRYDGMEEGQGVLDQTEFKRTGVKDGGVTKVRVVEGDTVAVHGLDVLIFWLYPDHIRFGVEMLDIP